MAHIAQNNVKPTRVVMHPEIWAQGSSVCLNYLDPIIAIFRRHICGLNVYSQYETSFAART
jgi:hypothetical protein